MRTARIMLTRVLLKEGPQHQDERALRAGRPRDDGRVDEVPVAEAPRAQARGRAVAPLAAEHRQRIARSFDGQRRLVSLLRELRRREVGEEDAHVFELAEAVRRIVDAEAS